MATEIFIPKVDMVMETGTFIEWLKAEGQPVQKGEALFVIQTDKAAIEVEALESGILAGLAARPDDVIAVNSIIGFILQPGEALPVDPGASPLPAAQSCADLRAEPGTAARVVPVSKIIVETNQAGEPTVGVRATPLARSLARDLRLNLQEVQGSGSRGRIYRADVERYSQSLKRQQESGRAEPAFIDGVSSGKPATGLLVDSRTRVSRKIPLKGPRAIIAERLTRSVQTIPHIHITLAVDMSEAARLREKLNPVYEKQTGRNISYTAILARAAAYSLKKHP
ncbi:MAG: 2-oxo acid dehydrogenase subunit E2, partial [Anaerolineaceae bacterium]|nr:2-oxo acid dehydrogenase subunit E2 [Anaerolineaceae bacterium]